MENFVCKNCGECCGPVPIIEEERKRIIAYLQKHHDVRLKAKQKDFSFTCVFRDEKNGCLIYPCRPKICRKFTCSSDKWKQEMNSSVDSDYIRSFNEGAKLINECFGADCYKEKYKELLNRI